MQKRLCGLATLLLLLLLLVAGHAARDILVPRPRIEPLFPALEAQSQPLDWQGSPHI